MHKLSIIKAEIQVFEQPKIECSLDRKALDEEAEA